MRKRNALWLVLAILIWSLVIAESSFACTDNYYNSVSACCDGNCPDCTGSSCSCPSNLCGIGSCPDCDTGSDNGGGDSGGASGDSSGGSDSGGSSSGSGTDGGSSNPPPPSCGQAGYCGVYGNYPGCKACFSPTTSSINYPSVEVLNNIPAIFSNPNWQNSFTQYVPASLIHLIPPDKIDVTKAIDYSKITKAQLLYENNFNLISDKSLLNPSVLNQAISEITGMELVIILNPGSDIIKNEDQIYISKATLLKVKCDNSPNYIEITNIKQEYFKKLNNDLEITANAEVSNNIKDCNKDQFTFTADKNGRIIISKDYYDPFYTLENGSINLNYETLITNTTASVSIDPAVGFVCLILGKGSEYRNDRDNFIAIEPMDGSDHQLCLRKKIAQLFTHIKRDDCINCSLFDLLSYQDNLIKGRLIFKRQTNNYWLNVFDNHIGEIIFKGMNQINYVKSNMQNGIEINSFISPANYYFLKEINNKQFINKYQLLQDIKSNSLIDEYYSSPTGINITINNNVMTINRVFTIYPKDSMPEEVFLYG
jgi:hypothetical protein